MAQVRGNAHVECHTFTAKVLYVHQRGDEVAAELIVHQDLPNVLREGSRVGGGIQPKHALNAF